MAFVAALVSTVLLSPFLIVGLVGLLTVQSRRALVEPVPGGKTTNGVILSVLTTGTILIASCAVLVLGVTVTAVLLARSRRR